MSFDLYGLADQFQAQTGEEADPNDPLGALRRPGGVNLNQATTQEMRPPQAPRPPKQHANNFHQGFATPMHNQQMQDFIDKFGPDAQANALQGMIGNTMQAYQDENDSRVAQEREMRRMQHEKEMKQMELDALIARLNAQQ
jgi:hypothetical protein